MTKSMCQRFLCALVNRKEEAVGLDFYFVYCNNHNIYFLYLYVRAVCYQFVVYTSAQSF